LACNPFYLLSAALLLFGVYRVSIEPGLLRNEQGQLLFNLSSLQIYEALVVVTAILLARRCIWYDSTLLVALENLLVLVPFMLVSQAALIDRQTVWVLSVACGLISALRFQSLRRFIAGLNVPPRLVVAGGVVLLVNVALPIVYRHWHESKWGTRLDSGAAYYTNVWAWLLVLPLLCALANLLPPMRRASVLPPQRGWLPLALFALWLTATGVHLYSLGYVYDFALRHEWVAPSVWVLAWTGFLRAAEWQPGSGGLGWRRLYLLPPLLAALIGISDRGRGVFLALTALNLAFYCWLWFRHRGERLLLHLVAISLVALVGGLPVGVGQPVVTGFSCGKALAAGAAAYLLIWAALSRAPMLGLLGALVAGSAVAVVGGGEEGSLHWAVQTATAFLLIHSLGWNDDRHEGARVVRSLAALAWLIHAVVWLHGGGAMWMPLAVAAPVAAGCGIARLMGCHVARVIPVTAILVMISGPADFAVCTIPTAPAGLLAVAGSFVLFGLGTLAALTRHRWQHSESAPQSGESTRS
jgi:hypothetical protein